MCSIYLHILLTKYSETSLKGLPNISFELRTKNFGPTGPPLMVLPLRKENLYYKQNLWSQNVRYGEVSLYQH